jgi:hypothetical protein
MKTYSKLLAMVVLAGGGAALAGMLTAGCTIRTVDCNVTPNDPICLQTDSSPPRPDAGPDGARPDASGDAAICPEIGPNGIVDFTQAFGPACNGCMQNNCCAPTVACFSDVGDGGTNIDTCNDLYQCYLDCDKGCGTDNSCFNTCVDQCNKDHPKSLPKYNDYDSCLTTKCATDCK